MTLHFIKGCFHGILEVSRIFILLIMDYSEAIERVIKYNDYLLYQVLTHISTNTTTKVDYITISDNEREKVDHIAWLDPFNPSYVSTLIGANCFIQFVTDQKAMLGMNNYSSFPECDLKNYSLKNEILSALTDI